MVKREIMIEKSGTATGIFHRAREVVEQDASITAEDKKSILKLLWALIDAEEAAKDPQHQDELASLIVQEILTGYSLLKLAKQQANELDALKNISLNLTASLDLQTVLDGVVMEAMRLIKDAFAAHIFLYSHGILTFGASLNMYGEKNKPISQPRPNGLTYSVAKNGETIIVEDMQNHLLYDEFKSSIEGSIIGIPLKFNNVIVGVMNLSRAVAGQFSNSELRLSGLLADHAAVAISNARLHKGVTELANTDSVTGLPNRRALDERLQDEMHLAVRSNSQFSVVMMDLDGFKNVNDTYGHSVGDDVLRDAFNHLAEKMRTTDFLARYGGDELTLVMRGSGLEPARIVTMKIIELMKEYRFPFPGDTNVQLGITAGIAVYPLHARNAGDLLRAADAALYHAKKYSRGSYAIAKGETKPLDPAMLDYLPKVDL